MSRGLYSSIVSSAMKIKSFVYPALALCASAPYKKLLESTECITLGMSKYRKWTWVEGPVDVKTHQ